MSKIDVIKIVFNTNQISTYLIEENIVLVYPIEIMYFF